MKRAFPTVFRLRTVTPDDAEALLRIYAPYVEETAISFEYAVPTAAEFRRRIENIRQKYPYLAAEDEAGRLLGYAYTHDFIAREAYDHCAETTIYIGRDLRRSGLGKALYGALEDISRAQNRADRSRRIPDRQQYPFPRASWVPPHRCVRALRIQIRPLVQYSLGGKAFGRASRATEGRRPLFRAGQRSRARHSLPPQHALAPAPAAKRDHTHAAAANLAAAAFLHYARSFFTRQDARSRAGASRRPPHD